MNSFCDQLKALQKRARDGDQADLIYFLIEHTAEIEAVVRQIEWIKHDFPYKAPEQITKMFVSERYIQPLNELLAALNKEKS